MKLQIFFLFFSGLSVVFPFKTNSQNWPKIYGADNSAVIMQFGEDYDQGYFIGSGLVYNGLTRRGWILKTDVNGNTLWEKKIGIGQTLWSLRGIDKTYDGGLIITGDTDTLDSNYDPYIGKLNACGEVEWCRIFHTENDPDGGIKLVSLHDHTYILLLHNWGYSPIKQTVWLMHLDETGGILWEQQYFRNDTLVSPLWENDLCLAPEGKYLITGTCYRPYQGQTQPSWPWPMIVLADSSGEAAWETAWGSGLPFSDQVGGEGFHSVKISNTTFSSISDYHWPVTQSVTSPCFIKTSSEGIPQYYRDLISNTQYGKASTLNKVNDTTLIIGACYDTGYQTPPPVFLSVLKTDTMGNVLRIKVLNNHEYIPKDAIITQDNKYLITAPDFIGSKWIFYLWKLNMDLEYDSIYTQPITYDSLCPYPITSGTLFFQCDITTGMQEPAMNTEKVKMLVYPNPGSGIITLKLPEYIQLETETQHLKVTTVFHEWKKDLTLQVFDGFGREILSETIMPETKEVSRDVSNWTNGIYYFRLTYKDRPVATAKFVKIK
jgi:hypothetical protein